MLARVRIDWPRAVEIRSDMRNCTFIFEHRRRWMLGKEAQCLGRGLLGVSVGLVEFTGDAGCLKRKINAVDECASYDGVVGHPTDVLHDRLCHNHNDYHPNKTASVGNFVVETCAVERTARNALLCHRCGRRLIPSGHLLADSFGSGPSLPPMGTAIAGWPA